MPLADEATEWTKKLVDQKMVRVKLLSRDQYQRVVGKVSVRSNRFVPFLKTDVTLSLANKGYATLYTGGGAQYDVSSLLMTVECSMLVDFLLESGSSRPLVVSVRRTRRNSLRRRLLEPNARNEAFGRTGKRLRRQPNTSARSRNAIITEMLLLCS